MASIDYENDIHRIIDIIKSNINIWNPISPAGKLQTIKFGEQDGGGDETTIIPPFCVITTPDIPFITKDSLGIGENSSDPQNSILYEIKIFAQAFDSELTEKQLYSFLKEITDTLRANPRGKDPTLNNDPKWIRSFIKSISQKSDTRGDEIQSCTITLQCQIGDSIQLIYDGLTISVLEELNSPHGWNTTNSPDDDGLIDVAPILLEEKKILKIETNPTIDAALRGKLRSPGYKSTTITKNGTARNITNSMLTRMSESVVYDQISQAVIEIVIIRDTS